MDRVECKYVKYKLRKDGHLEADAVKEILIIDDIWVFLGDLPAGRQEHTIGHLPVATFQLQFTKRVHKLLT